MTRAANRSHRQRWIWKSAIAAVATLALGVPMSVTSATAVTIDQPWRDTSLAPETRAQLMLNSLSFDEKIDFALWLKYPYPTPAGAEPSYAAAYGLPAPAPRDSPNGVFYIDGVTQFPSELNLASTWDTDLADQFGTAVAQELRGKGYNGWLGPGLDLARNPLWGRIAGNPGEDKLLAGEITSAEVRGAQGQNITTVLKHFVGNLQETGRFGSPAVLAQVGNPGYNVQIDERTLNELYAEPFRRAVQEGGATTLMCSYQQIDFTPTCERSDILAIPREQWGFKGNIIPDFVAAYRDALSAVNAGVDVTADPAPNVPNEVTREDFTSGRISAERLDEIVLRTLYSYFASGLYDNPLARTVQQGPIADNVSTADHIALARKIAEDSATLLKNDGALPLASGANVAVIGRAQADAVTIEGGSDYVVPNGVTPTALEAITTRSTGSVSFSQGTVGDTPLSAIPIDYLTPASGSGKGLTADYYRTWDLSGTPEATQVAQNFQYTSDPYPGLGGKWSVRYRGTLTPPETGLYQFSLNGAGTSRIEIDGQELAHGVTEASIFLGGQPYVYTGEVQLQAGVPVPITVEYGVAESLFGPTFNLGWQTPGQSMIAAAVETARDADSAVVFVGQGSGEGMDRSTLSLGGDQDELIAAVAAVNPRTTVVLSTPGAVLMPWLDDVEAVIQAGYQGQQFGTAISSVLYGDVNPSGKLAITYPRDESQGQATEEAQFPGTVLEVDSEVTPEGAIQYNTTLDEGIYMGYKFYDKHDQDPLFSFGHGLSYTTFAYSDLTVRNQVVPASGARPAASDEGSVSLTVTNTGATAGEEVVQVYAGALPTSVDTPERQLAGFARVALAAGESKTIEIPVDTASISYYDSSDNAWVTPQGTVSVYVGSSHDDIRLEGSLTVSPRASVVDAPTISGTTEVGKTLRAKPGEWDTKGLKFTYEWLRDGQPIDGATKSTYKLTKADAGTAVSVRVTASKKGFADASATSEPITVNG